MDEMVGIKEYTKNAESSGSQRCVEGICRRREPGGKDGRGENGKAEGGWTASKKLAEMEQQ
jgi:hypothetical protein